jgi:hypothetical protein
MTFNDKKIENRSLFLGQMKMALQRIPNRIIFAILLIHRTAGLFASRPRVATISDATPNPA